MRKLNKFQTWFLKFMNEKGGAQAFVLIGLVALAILIGPFFIQAYNILTSDMNAASIAIVIFGVLCVIVSITGLILFLCKIGKTFFK